MKRIGVIVRSGWVLAVVLTASPLSAARAETLSPESSVGKISRIPLPTSTRRPQKQRKDSNKDAEGTAAPNRFEAETVIKSQYTLDGKPLEVDPD